MGQVADVPGERIRLVRRKPLRKQRRQGRSFARGHHERRRVMDGERFRDDLRRPREEAACHTVFVLDRPGALRRTLHDAGPPLEAPRVEDVVDVLPLQHHTAVRQPEVGAGAFQRKAPPCLGGDIEGDALGNAPRPFLRRVARQEPDVPRELVPVRGTMNTISTPCPFSVARLKVVHSLVRHIIPIGMNETRTIVWVIVPHDDHTEGSTSAFLGFARAIDEPPRTVDGLLRAVERLVGRRRVATESHFALPDNRHLAGEVREDARLRAARLLPEDEQVQFRRGHYGFSQSSFTHGVGRQARCQGDFSPLCVKNPAIALGMSGLP